MATQKKKRYPYVVCKPCWELHYCPYGPLVEYYPLIGVDSTPGRQKLACDEYHAELERFAKGVFKTEQDIHLAVQYLLYHQPYKWRLIDEYDCSELECRIFGHLCPVFFVAETDTESKAKRKASSRRYVPRDVMLQVVRRDGQVCQSCGKNVPDNEVAFDHIIPVSKGGPTTTSNIRLLCRACNQRRSNSVQDILDR